MPTYELTGRLTEKYNEQKVSDSFRKREFVVEARENKGDREFIESIKFQVIQDKCSILDSLNLNDDVTVTFNIRGRRYDKDGKTSYFTNLEAWKVERIGALRKEPAKQDMGKVQQQDVNNSAPDDDLPF